jgi:hypothetical protein
MPAVNLVYYPQMARAAEYYRRSSHYCGERLLPMEQFEQNPAVEGDVVVLGRTGNCHQLDLHHLRLLRAGGKIPAPEDTSIAVFDWHEDFDNNPEEHELTSANWAWQGLQEPLYANLFVVGVNPHAFNELNWYQWEEDELRPTGDEVLRLLDRLCLYPAAPAYYGLKLFPECEAFLEANHSIACYHAVRDGGFVMVQFRGMDEVSYVQRKRGMVVDIDLDVLTRTCLRADCPQGIMTVAQLITHLGQVRRSGPISACLICGLTEADELLDEQSLESLSEVLAACTGLFAERPL